MWNCCYSRLLDNLKHFCANYIGRRCEAFLLSVEKKIEDEIVDPKISVVTLMV